MKNKKKLFTLNTSRKLRNAERVFYQYLERILLLLKIIDGIAYGILSFESCSLMVFFVLLVIFITNKNINGIINEILSLKSCLLNFFYPVNDF